MGVGVIHCQIPLEARGLRPLPVPREAGPLSGWEKVSGLGFIFYSWRVELRQEQLALNCQNFPPKWDMPPQTGPAFEIP